MRLQLILASQSPRRSEILQNAGFCFRKFSPNISEILNENLSLDEAIMALAEEKALHVTGRIKSRESGDFLVLAADTVVILDGQVLGKPSSHDEAKEFLRRLSSREHLVKTGLCFLNSLTQEKVLAIDTSKVCFYELTDEQIENYVASGEPMDKAGAYGIQGEGQKFVRSLDGSFENVMGLPIQLVEKILKEKSWYVDSAKS